MLFYGLKKVEILDNDKKLKLDQGKVIMYLDGFIEHDYEHRWEMTPILQFLRTIFDKFIYKFYTERFEQRITYEMHQLYDNLESYFNMYKHYAPVSKVSHFSH